MKQSLVLIIFLFAFLGVFAQHLDIEGSAKISTMALDNAADSLVVKQSDGTLALREVSSLPDLSGWETDDIDVVDLAVDSAEVHIGVDFNSPIGDKVFIRGLDPNKHPLRVQVGSGQTRLYVKSNGGVTIGAGTTTGPARGLYVYQDQSIGTSTTNARLEVSNSQGFDRDTMLLVNQNSSLTTGTHYGVRVENNPATTSTSYGYYHNRSSGGNGIRHGYRTSMAGGTGVRYGVSSSLSSAAGNASTAYGVYSFVSSAATTGTSYAGYFSSSANTAGQWCIYALGDSYFSGDVRITTTVQATGYELSVNGEIMCEDLTIQDSGSWPDYVFNDDYDLLSIDDFKASIHANKHLPGIPSEKEMEENGIHVAEMHKMTIEKIEELSLYIIELHDRVKTLEAENKALKSESR